MSYAVMLLFKFQQQMQQNYFNSYILKLKT